jgi:hypothetical protein
MIGRTTLFSTKAQGAPREASRSKGAHPCEYVRCGNEQIKTRDWTAVRDNVRQGDDRPGDRFGERNQDDGQRGRRKDGVGRGHVARILLDRILCIVRWQTCSFEDVSVRDKDGQERPIRVLVHLDKLNRSIDILLLE